MNETHAQEAAAAAVGTLATKATNWGAAAAVAGGFLAENWVSLAGLTIALAGFFVNWYYKHQEFKRRCEAARHDG